MAGGVGPSIVNVGQRIFCDEFKSIIMNGRGQMPGFPHVDEQTMTGIVSAIWVVIPRV